MKGNNSSVFFMHESMFCGEYYTWCFNQSKKFDNAFFVLYMVGGYGGKG